MGKYTKKNAEYWSKNLRTNENGITERYCNTCGEWKEENTDNFYLRNKSKPEKGYGSECKICASKRSYEIQLKNPERTTKSKQKYYQNNLDKWYNDRIEYYKTHDGKEIQKRWYQNNPEKAKENQQYRQKHKMHDITNEQWQACKEYFNNSCAYCGLPIEKHTATRNNKTINMDLHKEHVDDEGSNGLENCVPSCQSCNSSKRQYKLGVWYSPKNKRRGGKVFLQERLDKINKWITEDYKQYINITKVS
jgi:hypothetical protein